MSVKPVIDLFKGRYYRPTLQDDPLNDAQKLAIWEFVDRHLFSKEIERSEWEPLRKKTFFELDHSRSDVMRVCRALSKTYDSYDTESLAKIKASFSSQECFEEFRQILRNPAVNADEFHLSRDSKPQIFAAQIFMKVVIQNAHSSHSIQENCAKYCEKMASSRGCSTGSSAISAKNQLLMQDDPIQRLPQRAVKSPLEVIFAHTFFQVPQMSQTMTMTESDGAIREITTTYGPTREQTREIMRKLLTDLAENPKVKHVMEALATLILKEKGNIFFGNMSSLGRNYAVHSTVLGGVDGFYNQRHCIMMPHCINEYDSQPLPWKLSTFVHETLHFLFNRLVGNSNSPVKKGTEQEALLDKALKLDREHRKTIDPNQLQQRQKSIWVTLVSQLEKEPTYFRGPAGFDPDDADDASVMRAEAIVRIMEQTVNGATDEDFRAIAPNLFNFYYRYSKPLLEQYVLNNAHLFQPPVAFHTPVYLSKTIELSWKERFCQRLGSCFQWFAELFMKMGRLICGNRSS
jgi:hypothetical protein